jgi:hypothetical protein
MKKFLLKSLLWTLGCGLGLLILLFAVKKSFANAVPQDTCSGTEMPDRHVAEPLWESFSHQFVSIVPGY